MRDDRPLLVVLDLSTRRCTACGADPRRVPWDMNRDAAYSASDVDQRSRGRFTALGYLMEHHLPILTFVRSLCTVWAICFLVFFVGCMGQSEAFAVTLQRRLTESWLSPLYTGHVAVDALLCISGVLLGRQLFTAVCGCVASLCVCLKSH
jgi:hypothetical protein